MFGKRRLRTAKRRCFHPLFPRPVGIAPRLLRESKEEDGVGWKEVNAPTYMFLGTAVSGGCMPGSIIFPSQVRPDACLRMKRGWYFARFIR